MIPGIQPILEFRLPDTGLLLVPSPALEYSMYLFDMRDLDPVVRFLLYYGRHFTSGMGIDVYLNELHVPGFCNVGNAADRLFLSPLWPWLNGELRLIYCGKAIIDMRWQNYGCNIAECNETAERARVLQNIFLAISGTKGSSKLQSGRWDPQAAERVWDGRLQLLEAFIISGEWTADQPWEVLCHENFHNLRDQLDFHGRQHNSAGDSEKAATIMAHLLLFAFAVAAIHLNLAHTEDREDCLNLSDHALTERARKNLSLVWDWLDDSPSASAEKIYVSIAITEMWARKNLVRVAWYQIYRIFLLVEPAYSLAGWLKAQMRIARADKKRYFLELGGHVEDNEQAGRVMWIKNGSVRALFFRQLCKTRIIPLVIAKHGDEEGLIFRRMVVSDANEWVKRYGKNRKF